MTQEPIALIVLAAGRGKRLGGESPKVLIDTSEDTLLGHVLKNVASLKPSRLVVVTGYRREEVEREASALTAEISFPCKCEFAFQSEQKGTGHAALCAADQLSDHTGPIIIVSGDMPLIKEECLQRLLAHHQSSLATVSVLTSLVDEQKNYGRIIRSNGAVSAIREVKDASEVELLIREVNTSVYVVDSAFLWPALKNLSADNSQKEYYLTDIVAAAHKDGQRISSSLTDSSDEILGVNTYADLALVNLALNRRRVTRLIEQGVLIEDPATCYLESSVTVAAGVRIGPNTSLRGKTVIQTGAEIDGNAFIQDCTIEAQAHIKFGVYAQNAHIGPRTSVGPFAHIREGTHLKEGVKIGNFVETKKAVLEAGVKANHLTYLGDCSIGEESNIGAGTITCNYDGYKKSRTEIGKGVFVGSNSSLVAPVSIGDGASIGAGSIITSNVESDALALTRAPQVSKSGWSKRKRELMQKKSK